MRGRGNEVEVRKKGGREEGGGGEVAPASSMSGRPGISAARSLSARTMTGADRMPASARKEGH